MILFSEGPRDYTELPQFLDDFIREAIRTKPSTPDVESGHLQKKALQRFIFPRGGLHAAVWRRNRLHVQYRTIIHNEEIYSNMLMHLTDIRLTKYFFKFLNFLKKGKKNIK